MKKVDPLRTTLWKLIKSMEAEASQDEASAQNATRDLCKWATLRERARYAWYMAGHFKELLKDYPESKES